MTYFKVHVCMKRLEKSAKTSDRIVSKPRMECFDVTYKLLFRIHKGK
jgi:hypothetical protein